MIHKLKKIGQLRASVLSWRRRKKIITASGLLVAISLLGFGLFVWPGIGDKDRSTASGAPIEDICSTNLSYSCYKQQLIDITSKNGSEKAMELIKTQAPKIPYVLSQCHQLTHVVGRAAYNKYQDLGETFYHGDHYCASGYFHGASEEIVAKKGAKYFATNANKVCNAFTDRSKYSSGDHYNCLHGLGHGLLEAENQELFIALKACDALKDTWEKQSCHGGVFMQNIMIAQGTDAIAPNTSKYLRPTEPMYPCTAVEEEYKPGCYIIQSSYALSVLSFDFSKVFALCAQVPNSYNRIVCYQSVGRDASGGGQNRQLAKDRCLLGANSEAQSNCAIGAAKDIVYSFHSDKQALEFCQSLPADFISGCDSAVKAYFATF